MVLFLLFILFFFIDHRKKEGFLSKEPRFHIIQGDIKGGGTLSKSLKNKNIHSQWIELIILKLKPYIKFNKIKGGTYRIIFDLEGDLIKFIFEESPIDIFEIEKDSYGYHVQKKEISLEAYLNKVEGKIHTSLFESMNNIGEKDQLAISFADILSWEIDFFKDIREGDGFKILVDKIYKGNEFIKYGTIHALEYDGKEKTIRGIYFKDGFYDERGASFKRAFLKAPLQFNRISSRFRSTRKHPILGGVKPHYGVDYSAPIGTPVRAVADGTVIMCGWNNDYGNQIILRHKNRYVTYYGHLSHIDPGVKRGTNIKQRQIIGYVGSTGLSTGPHLDYRLVKDGLFRNPLKEIFPSVDLIKKEEREGFQKKRDEMIEWLRGNIPITVKISKGPLDVDQPISNFNPLLFL